MAILLPFFRGQSVESHQARGRFPGLAEAARTPGCALSLPKPVHESQNRAWNRRESSLQAPSTAQRLHSLACGGQLITAFHFSTKQALTGHFSGPLVSPVPATVRHSKGSFL